MSDPDPWTFGINHLLTITGFGITAAIAIAGFRTFRKWKREKIEEKRIDIALEALAIAYEARFVFDGIRSPLSYSSEWAEMSGTDEDRRKGGAYFAVLRRLDNNREYFERLWRFQPRFMAAFGKDTQDIFLEIHSARRAIEVSASMLMEAALKNDPFDDREFERQLRADVWSKTKGDNISQKIDKFIAGLEKHCMPMVVHGYRD